jgi:hypothetical protein
LVDDLAGLEIEFVDCHIVDDHEHVVVNLAAGPRSALLPCRVSWLVSVHDLEASGWWKSAYTGYPVGSVTRAKFGAVAVELVIVALVRSRLLP